MMRRRLRARPTAGHPSSADRDGGYTLIELLISMSVTALALTLVVPVIITTGSVSNATGSSSNANAQARQALLQLSADVGSANSNNVCFPPTGQTAVSVTCPTGATSGNTMRVLSSVYSASSTSPTCKWFQWTIANNELNQQSWPSTWTSSNGTPPVVPVIGAVNTTGAPSVFSLNTTGLIVNIQITLQGSAAIGGSGARTTAGANSQPVTLQSAVSLFSSSLAAGSC